MKYGLVSRRVVSVVDVLSTWIITTAEEVTATAPSARVVGVKRKSYRGRIGMELCKTCSGLVSGTF